MKFETVLGLEVHAQLSTRAKLFSNASTHFGASPNTQATYLDAGYPGTLPVLNAEVLRMAIQFGLSVNAAIDDHCCFDRKNYFYPDLPKGYQITQHFRPIIKNGYLQIQTPNHETKAIHIAYAHIEEDAGKSQHQIIPGFSGINLNRAGVPLLEIVTSPCLYSAEEVIAYLKTLHQHLRFLNICDGNMQEGSFRCDVNLSIREKGDPNLGTRTELKNINSFRFIEKAIAIEQQRHMTNLEQGAPIIQETRGYCPDSNTTYSLREKEDHADYRYVPDPDLRPIPIHVDYLNEIKNAMPLSPCEIKNKLIHEDKLTENHIEFIMSSFSLYNFYSCVKQHTHASRSLIVNWLKGPYSACLHLANADFERPPLSDIDLGYLLDHIQDNTLSQTRGKQILTQSITGHQSIRTLINNELTSNTHETMDISALIQQIIDNNPQQIEEYCAGKDKLLGFFIGIMMKALKGKGDPAVLAQQLKEKLKART